MPSDEGLASRGDRSINYVRFEYGEKVNPVKSARFEVKKDVRGRAGSRTWPLPCRLGSRLTQSSLKAHPNPYSESPGSEGDARNVIKMAKAGLLCSPHGTCTMIGLESC